MHSDLIVGVNIVGPENGVVAIRDYTLHMKMFRFLKQRLPTVKLAMHSGELVLGMVPPEDLQFHIREAIEIAGASRIGHGIDMFYERNAFELLQKMKELNVVVEVVISSNAFILGVKNDAHPMLVYKAHGVPLVIATDDAGVSRSTLSNEYLMFSDRYKPSYAELKTLVYNSIRFSFLSESEKQEQLEKLDARFADFEAMIADVVSSLSDSGVSSSGSSWKEAVSQITLSCCSLCLLIQLIF
jgi:adenosine deaminase/adenosine deaminase CECR1